MNFFDKNIKFEPKLVNSNEPANYTSDPSRDEYNVFFLVFHVIFFITMVKILDIKKIKLQSFSILKGKE